MASAIRRSLVLLLWCGTSQVRASNSSSVRLLVAASSAGCDVSAASRATLAAISPIGVPSQQPLCHGGMHLYLKGMQKSGTTWLELLIRDLINRMIRGSGCATVPADATASEKRQMSLQFADAGCGAYCPGQHLLFNEATKHTVPAPAPQPICQPAPRNRGDRGIGNGAGESGGSDDEGAALVSWCVAPLPAATLELCHPNLPPRRSVRAAHHV